MTISVQNCLKGVYVHYKGKQSKVPPVGTDKFISAIIILQDKIREWATDPYNDWQSLWQDVAAGTIAAGTSTYDLDDSIQRPSDRAIVTKSGQITKISIIKVTDRHYPQYVNSSYAYLTGDNPKKITINTTITTTTPIVGGTMTVPAYILPDILTSDATNVQLTDDITIDDINWLQYAVAAEIARNDPAKRDQYPNLQGLANSFWEKMVAANSRLPATNPDMVESDMPNMGGYL